MTWNGGSRVQWSVPAKGMPFPASLRFLNEANAGDGGFLRASGNRIIHSNTGERFRARGHQLIWQAAFPSVAEAPQIAKRLADLGVNFIRLNGDEKLHGTATSSGFWWDNTAADYMTFDTTPPPDNFLLLWDNFQNELKKQGIYVSLCLFDIKPYPAATRPLAYQTDTWPGTGNYGKGIHILDVRKDHDKQYLINFLTRPNSVTGIAPVDDPAYHDVYIQNEQSVIQAWYQNNFNFKPSGGNGLIGQVRTEMIARWSAFAEAHGQDPQGELVSTENGVSWGAGVPPWDLATPGLQTVWMQWLEEEDRLYAEEMYAFLRSIGWKAMIRISTANYVPISQEATDVLCSHNYAANYSGAATVLTTNTTRTAGSNVVTVASATGLYKGCSVQNVTGIPTGTWVTNVSGLNVTLSQPCATSGTTSTQFYSPVKEGALHWLADHTGNILSGNFTQVRNWNKPYLTDEIGMKSAAGMVGILSPCYYDLLSVYVGLHDTDGYACFIYEAPQSYPDPLLNSNTFSMASLHSEMNMSQSLLGLMSLNLLTAKGYMSPLVDEVPIKINYENLIARMVASKSSVAYALPTGIVGGSQLLQRRVGLIYTGVGGEDTTGATEASKYPPSINFSGVGVKTTIFGQAGDKYTWDRSRDGGTYVIHESPYDLVAFGVLPESFTSAINGVTIEFPPLLTVTGSCTSGSNVVNVPDASAWELGEYVAIAGVYFTSSNPQRIARVADRDLVLNKLTLVTEGGSTGVIDAPAQQTVGSATITKPQWGRFSLVSMDGTPLGQGKALLLCNGTSWSANVWLMSNTEYAAANAVSIPTGGYMGTVDGNRNFVDLPIAKITMPNPVNVTAVDSEGATTNVANGATSFGLVKNPLYLING